MKDPLKKFYRKERLRKKIFWLSRAISRIQPGFGDCEVNISKQHLNIETLTFRVTIYRELCIEKIFITRITYKHLRIVNGGAWQLIREGKTEDIVL